MVERSDTGGGCGTGNFAHETLTIIIFQITEHKIKLKRNLEAQNLAQWFRIPYRLSTIA